MQQMFTKLNSNRRSNGRNSELAKESEQHPEKMNSVGKIEKGNEIINITISKNQEYFPFAHLFPGGHKSQLSTKPSTAISGSRKHRKNTNLNGIVMDGTSNKELFENTSYNFPKYLFETVGSSLQGKQQHHHYNKGTLSKSPHVKANSNNQSVDMKNQYEGMIKRKVRGFLPAGLYYSNIKKNINNYMYEKGKSEAREDSSALIGFPNTAGNGCRNTQMNHSCFNASSLNNTMQIDSTNLNMNILSPTMGSATNPNSTPSSKQRNNPFMNMPNYQLSKKKSAPDVGRHIQKAMVYKKLETHKMSVIPFTSSFEVATQANCKFLHKDDLTPLNLNKHKLHIKHKSKSAKNAKIKTNKSFEVKQKERESRTEQMGESSSDIPYERLGLERRIVETYQQNINLNLQELTALQEGLRSPSELMGYSFDNSSNFPKSGNPFAGNNTTGELHIINMNASPSKTPELCPALPNATPVLSDIDILGSNFGEPNALDYKKENSNINNRTSVPLNLSETMNNISGFEFKGSLEEEPTIDFTQIDQNIETLQRSLNRSDKLNLLGEEEAQSRKNSKPIRENKYAEGKGRLVRLFKRLLQSRRGKDDIVLDKPTYRQNNQFIPDSLEGNFLNIARYQKPNRNNSNIRNYNNNTTRPAQECSPLHSKSREILNGMLDNKRKYYMDPQAVFNKLQDIDKNRRLVTRKHRKYMDTHKEKHLVTINLNNQMPRKLFLTQPPKNAGFASNTNLLLAKRRTKKYINLK